MRSRPGPKAARKARRRYLFLEPEAWGSHHSIIVGPDQTDGEQALQPWSSGLTTMVASVELLVQEDALPEIALLSKLDSRL